MRGYQQQLSLEQALQKARHYCAYQERAHSEVKEKLYGFGLRRQEVEEALSRLIEENYLNEERFAIQFAGGRFRMKHWGRIRIRYELKQKQVGDYCIKKALVSIDEDEYHRTLFRLAEDKWSDLQEEEPYIRRQKLQAYLVQKGYETDRIQDVLAQLKEKE
ncbi:MAG: RecX family transcriptional regulator [Sphingobacteriales bacterium 50-39]|nr:RecX family transcriptional regulator [Sphingobacteriales bacterium]OJW57315.1 MAG: RecX family transcriptional regulator [Sphingobacteriales bacterium 50-39]